MDKASAYGARDCRFESYRGHLINAKTCVLSLIVGRRRHAWSPLQPDCILTCSGFGCFSTGSSLSCRADGSAEGLPPEAEELSAHDELLLPENCTMALGNVLQGPFSIFLHGQFLSMVDGSLDGGKLEAKALCNSNHHKILVPPNNIFQ